MFVHFNAKSVLSQTVYQVERQVIAYFVVSLGNYLLCVNIVHPLTSVIDAGLNSPLWKCLLGG